MRIIIRKIDRDAMRQQRPVIVHVIFFDNLGREIISMPIPVSQFRGELEAEQELVLVPKNQVDIST